MNYAFSDIGVCFCALVATSASVFAADGLACTTAGVELFIELTTPFPGMEWDGLDTEDGVYLCTYFNDDFAGFVVMGSGGYGDGGGVSSEGFRAATMAGSYAFVTESSSTVIVYDIHDRHNIVELGRVQAGVLLDELAVDGDVFAGRYDELGVSIIDVQDPANPVLASNLSSLGLIRAIDIRDDLLSIAIGSGEILLFDVSDPYLPALVSTVEHVDIDFNHRLRNEEDWLFSAGQIGLDVISLDDQSQPVVVSHFGYDELLDGFAIDPSELRSMDVEDSLLSLTFEYGGGFVLDISNPQQPHLIAHHDSQGAERAGAMDHGQYVQLTPTGDLYSSDVQALTTANPVMPVNGLLRERSAFNDIDIVDGRLYASGWAYTVHDVSDPSSIEQLEYYQFKSERVFGAVQYEGYSYLAAGSEGLVLIDHAHPDGGQILFSYNPIESVIGVCLDGSDMLVVDETGVVMLMDITIPEFPRIVSVASLPYEIERRSILFEDLVMYSISNIGQDQSVGMKLDLSNPLEPSLWTEFYDYNFVSLALRGEYIYAVSDGDQGGVAILDRSSLSMDADHFGFTGGFTSIEVIQDDQLLVGDSTGQVILLEPYPSLEVRGVIQARSANSRTDVQAIGVHQGVAFVGFDWGGVGMIDVSDQCSACLADFDSDGDLDFFDISSFIVAYSNDDPSVDFNDDGSLNFFDVSLFLEAFAQGCP